MVDRARSDAGFTLLETLVALVVLGFLMVGLTEGSRFGIAAWRHQADTIAERDQLDAIDRTLRQLLTHVTVRDSGKSNQLAFIGELPSSVALISRRADMRLLVDDTNRLVLRWTPQPHEMSLVPRPKPTDTVLLAGVDGLDVAYWQDSGDSTATGWSDGWSAADPPKLIKLTLHFPENNRRDWPAIIVAPLALGPGTMSIGK